VTRTTDPNPLLSQGILPTVCAYAPKSRARRHDPIGDLDKLMQKFRFHHLPVVTEDMKLVGIICRTDLLQAKLGVTSEGAPTPDIDATTTAETIMRKSVVVARPDSPLSTACQVMLDAKLSCLPVAQEDGTLVGMLTGADFMRLALAVI
ncbi:MAG: CBS domain-containing protein, partial [Polyangiaceae bacterium]|nr:CBS domain-containing protein [Polyangiaceae bacterium]